MDRRTFLTSTLIGAGMLALPELEAAEKRAKRKRAKGAQTAPAGTAAVLNLCSQESRIKGASLKEKIEKLQRWGATGIEFGGNPGNVAEIKAALAGTGLKVSALCWGADKGKLVSLDKETRTQGIADLKAALVTAGELETVGGVIFVPCFNKDSQLKADELDKIMADILPEIGDFAKAHNTRVLLEPLNKKEAYYINRVEQAAAICNKINNDGICLMGDFYHMFLEEKDQTQAFISGGKYLRHVHLATGKSRIMPGQEPHSYVEGFIGLKKMGYQGYCSLECGCKKGTTSDEAIPAAFEYLRKQWDEAKA